MWVPVALMVAGAVMSAVSSIQQGQAAKAAAQHNADMMRMRAQASRQQAQFNAEQQQRQAHKQIGAMAAGYGASGITLEGSPLDVLEESASAAERDKQAILYRGELAAWGYGNEATLDEFSGANAQRAGYFGAASSILGGAGKAMSMGGGGSPMMGADDPLYSQGPF